MLAEARGALDSLPSEAPELPIVVDVIPLRYPPPIVLQLWIIPF